MAKKDPVNRMPHCGRFPATVGSDLLKTVYDDVERSIRETRINASQERCVDQTLPRNLDHPKTVLTGRHLRDLLHRDAHLIYYSNMLFSEITAELGHTKRILFVVDNAGYVVHIASDPDILESMTRDNGIDIGASLAESSCGTNAVDLAMRHRQPFVLCGEEHYCALFSDWRCVATPIVDSHGKLVAVIQVSSDNSTLISINALLVKLVARELQNLYSIGAIHRSLYPHPANSFGQNAEWPETERPPNLTDRQLEVLELYAHGMSYKEIARKLNVTSVKTVSEHLDAARRKLSASSRRQAIEKAVALGLFQ